MLRLASRSSQSPPSPQRLRLFPRRGAHSTSPSFPQGGRDWAPGDPIRLAAPAMTRLHSEEQQRGEGGSAARGEEGMWTPGDPIRFGGESSRLERVQSSGIGAPDEQKKCANFSFSPLRLFADLFSLLSLSTPTRTAPTLTQQDLDDLCAGVDWDDLAEIDLEVASVQASPSKPTLPPKELEELLEGIDFSQDLELSDVESVASVASDDLFFSAPTSTRPLSPIAAGLPPPRPATPVSTAARVILRSSPASSRPAPSSPAKPDLFSPFASTSRTLPSSALPLSALSSAPPSAAAAQLRAFSSSSTKLDNASPAQPPKPRTVIDLTDSPSSSPAERSFGAALDANDDSIVVVFEEPESTSKAPSKSSSGWFQRPPTSSLAPASTAPPPPSAPSTAAPARPASSATSYRPSTTRHLARGASRPARPGTKRAKEEEKQAGLREKWPREFSYRTWEAGRRGEVEVTVTTEERVVERVLAQMHGPLGFDLEWDPYVRNKSGETFQGRTAVVQVCDEKRVLLVHVARMPNFPLALKQLIEDPNRIKLGVQIAGDARKLERDFGHRPAGTLELNALVRTYDPERFVGRTKPGLIGLQELTGIYLDRYLPKEGAVRCSRWTGPLDEHQIEYAVNDVYASLYVLKAIESLSSSTFSPTDLAQLASRPYDNFSGFRTAAPATQPSTQSGSAYALPPLPKPDGADVPAEPLPPDTDPLSILSTRKAEAFVLFHHERLSLADIATRMSATGSAIKPLSVVWSLFAVFHGLRARGLAVEWDVPRLVEAAKEVKWSSRMKKDYGALLEELQAGLQEESSERSE
ncbi:hypothetical protein JCM10207_006616 [Rhodosporidiobolus poonsookiae]